MNSGGGFGLGLGFGLTPTSVIQVTNLSSAVTSEQMRTLFSFLGEIEELRLYPPDNAPLAFSSKSSDSCSLCRRLVSHFFPLILISVLSVIAFSFPRDWQVDNTLGFCVKVRMKFGEGKHFYLIVLLKWLIYDLCTFEILQFNIHKLASGLLWLSVVNLQIAKKAF
uniref:Splicing regulatory glutamic acid and lysine rich protein 1 n=1 Tax=Macaca fascicularis TaxID=9541 RepID=A0A2K5WXY3_MACFA